MHSFSGCRLTFRGPFCRFGYVVSRDAENQKLKQGSVQRDQDVLRWGTHNFFCPPRLGLAPCCRGFCALLVRCHSCRLPELARSCAKSRGECYRDRLSQRWTLNPWLLSQQPHAEVHSLLGKTGRNGSDPGPWIFTCKAN